MADPRFYDRLGPLSIEEIAALSGAAISDSGRAGTRVEGLAPLNAGLRGHLCYAESEKSLKGLQGTDLDGAIVLAPQAAAGPIADLGGQVLVHSTPRLAFARVAGQLVRPRRFEPGERVHATASIDASARLMPGAVIGAGAEIGADTLIEPNAVIGPGCRIGAGARIGAGVSIACAIIGSHCNILAGAVIGEDGFGVAVSAAETVDVPHLGIVLIGDHVTIGAHTAIDRALFGATEIGSHTKIDNHCHIAHNCRIGERVIMAGFSGMAGSAEIGEGAMLGGRVGIYDHTRVGAGARIAATAAVNRDVPPGETWAGNPAQPLRDNMREIAELRRLVKAKNNKKKD